jgi:hypothetical protein
MRRTKGGAGRAPLVRRGVVHMIAVGRRLRSAAPPLARSAFDAVREAVAAMRDDLRPFTRTVKHPGQRP